jgi:hypothetical protein
MRKASLFLFVTVVCFLAFYGFFTMVFKAYEWFNKPTNVASAYVKERHAYHGIGYSESYRGERYFYRNGKRVKL